MQDRRTRKEAPFLYQNIGRWWGCNPLKKRRRDRFIIYFQKMDFMKYTAAHDEVRLVALDDFYKD